MDKKGIILIFLSAVMYTEAANLTNIAHCRGLSTCLNLKDCTPFMSLLKNLRKPLAQSVVTFLKAQHCGFEDGHPKVCCRIIPNNHPIKKYVSDVTTNQTTQTPAKLNKTTTPEMIETTETTMKPKKNLKKLSEEFNYMFITEFWDSPYDLFRRRRGTSKKEYLVDVEIR